MAATQAALGPGRAACALAMLFLGSFVLGSGELLVGRRAECGRRRPPGLHPRGRRAGDRLRAGPRHRRADRPGRRLEPGRRCLASPATLGPAIRPRHYGEVSSHTPIGTGVGLSGLSLYQRTSQNSSSTTFVNTGRKKGRGCSRPRPSSLRGLACVWRMGFASARHLVRMSGHTAGLIDGRTGQADGKLYGTSRHNSFLGALYRT
jgi:hypothetical protein